MAENASFDVLIDEIRSSIFAVCDDKKKKGKGREGKGRYTSHNTLYFSYLWGGHPKPIFIKFGMRVVPAP